MSNQAQGNSNSNNINANNYNREDDLRNTLKKCPPKITGGHKLPDAFSNITSIKKNKNQLNSLNGKITPFQQLGKIDQQKNIESLIGQQEYKAVQNLLQPISVNEDRLSPQRNDPIDYQQELLNPRKLRDQQLQQQQQQQQQQQLNQKIPNHNLKNPLAPLKNYMMNIQQLQDNFKEFGEISKEKMQIIESNKQNQLIYSRIKLEEMITLRLMKGNQYSGAVKKMLHAPTLKLYAVKEEPVSTKEVRHSLRDWAVFRQSKLHDTGLHTKLYGTFWNTPEGCVSILTEFMSGGSLQVQYNNIQLLNLLESFGTIPEGVQKTMLPMIIQGLEDIHTSSASCFGNLSPSQILFKRDGSLKLSLGISYRITHQASPFFSSIHMKQSDRISLFDPNYMNTPNLFKATNPEKNAQQKEQILKADDVFRLGMLALACSIGSFDVIEHSQHLFDCIQFLLEDSNKPEPIHKVCCLLHSENIITQLIQERVDNASSNNNPSKQSAKTKTNITITNLLNPNRFSKEYFSFLCCSLRFNYQTRSTLAALKQHSFFSSNSKGLPITIHELLRISQEWNRQESLPQEFQGAQEQQLERVCSAMMLVLPNCEKWFKQPNYIEYTKHLQHQLSKDSPCIKALAIDLGLDQRLVADKINQIFSSFSFVYPKKQSSQQQLGFN